MKRIITVILLAAMLLTLAACGKAVLSTDITAITCSGDTGVITPKCEISEDGSRELLYCGVDSVKLAVGGEDLELADLFESERLTPDEFAKYLSENTKKWSEDADCWGYYSDGGSKEYRVGDYFVIYLNVVSADQKPNTNIAVGMLGGDFNIDTVKQYTKADNAE